MNHQKTKQSGFIVLMGMLALVVGAGLWFGTLGSLRSNTMAIKQTEVHIEQLHRIKEKMLTYAVLHPELYAESANPPGVGYFPCPDVDGDGDADSHCDVDSAGNNRLFVLGKVPYKISSRFFSFLDSNLDNSDYWFAVDARFVNSSQRFRTGGSERFSTLNIDIDKKVEDKNNNVVFPMTLDGKEDVVMVLFYAGSPLAGQARPSSDYDNYLEQPAITVGETIDFRSVGANSNVFNDYVIAITRAEWEAAVLSRVSQDTNPEDGVPDMCVSSVATDAGWFNDCRYTGANIPPFSNDPFPSSCVLTSVLAEENITGQNWRSIICP